MLSEKGEATTIFKRDSETNMSSVNNINLQNLQGRNPQCKSNRPLLNNWQNQTIWSSASNTAGTVGQPGDIKDRVQKALMKTKNVMGMLKTPKSSSAGK